MLLMKAEWRQTWARVLLALFMSASLLAGIASTADAAPRAKCRNNPENYSFYRGKCLSDKRIEVLKERRANHLEREREQRG